MKEQVLTIEQMQELKELGIDISNSIIGWFKWNNENTWYLLNETVAQRREKVETMIEGNCFYEDDYKSYKYTFIPTFTLQDILELLPDSIVDKDGYTRIQMILPQDNKEVIIAYDNVKQFSGSWLEAAFNMLKWVKQNNYI